MNPHNIEIFIYTEREGVLGAVGHDLKLAVHDFEVDPLNDGFIVTIQANSIKVAACIVDGREAPVGEKDRTTIEKNLNKDVLRTAQFRLIEFEGTIEPTDDTNATVRGELRLLGKQKQLEVLVSRTSNKWHGQVTLDQRDFGIKPFTAFLGALRIKPEVRVEVSADA